MEQMTVEKLYKELDKLMKAGCGNKKLITADDVEGNGYHGLFFSCTSDPKDVKENIQYSNGLSDSIETDCNNIVIIG